MSGFRGKLVLYTFPSVVEPHFDGSKFSVSDVIVPSSSEYTIADLISAGIKVAPVATDILHDASAVDSLPSLDVDTNDSSNVEPSNV